MLTRWPLLHVLAMAVVAVVFATLFWTGFTEYSAWLPLLAAGFAIPPAILLWKALRQPEANRNQAFAMAWVLLVGMLVVFTFFSSTALGDPY